MPITKARKTKSRSTRALYSLSIFFFVFSSFVLSCFVFLVCSMPSRFDIVGLGCAAVDDLLYVPMYPLADAKVQIHRRERQCGGLTATALVAAGPPGARWSRARRLPGQK